MRSWTNCWTKPHPRPPWKHCAQVMEDLQGPCPEQGNNPWENIRNGRRKNRDPYSTYLLLWLKPDSIPVESYWPKRALMWPCFFRTLHSSFGSPARARL